MQLAAYCLWLIPDEPAKHRLQSLIDDLASISVNNKGATFIPHITLLSNIPLSTPVDEIEGKTRQALKQVNEQQQQQQQHLHLQLHLLPAEGGTKYYQSVISPIRTISDSGSAPTLLAIRQACQEVFDLTSLPTYFPHLSLQYGDITSQQRDEIAAVANEQMKTIDPAVVDVTRVSIVRCEGAAKEWKVVSNIDL